MIFTARARDDLVPVTLVMAHRGASLAAPENTVEAFALARDLGADLVELDVRLTHDGALAVIHDPVLADGRVVADTDSLDLPDRVPFLAAALDACAGLVVNVEIKSSAREPGYDPGLRAADVLVELLASRDAAGDRVVVSSFSLPMLDRVHELAPALETAWLVSIIPSQAKLITTLVERGHRGVHPWHGLVTSRLVARCHAAGLAVRPWTVDDPARIAKLAAMGVDAVCTNAPDVARAALRDARA
jgi:glycerophosphoryl diester phosphodiesterase